MHVRNPASRIRTALPGAIMGFVLLCGTSYAAETMVTGGGGGSFPPNTIFNGIPITGLEFGFGLEFSSVGDKVGEVSVVLLGIGPQPREITIEGNVSGGSRVAANVATFLGQSPPSTWATVCRPARGPVHRDRHHRRQRSGVARTGHRTHEFAQRGGQRRNHDHLRAGSVVPSMGTPTNLEA